MQEMERQFFFPLLDSIKLQIFSSMDCATLLTCRLVCFGWNDLISTTLLPHRARLNIVLEKSRVCKKFRRGEWSDILTGTWDEISIHYPEEPGMFRNTNVFAWSMSSPTFNCFTNISKLTFWDCGKGAFLDFIHGILASMPNLHWVHVKAQNWPKHRALLHQRTLAYRPDLPTWGHGIKQARHLRTFALNIYERRTTIKYLNFFALIPSPLALETLDLDFSKCLSLPFNSLHIDEIYQILQQVIQNCAETLQNLRIKWDHRVEGDIELITYSRDFEPFAQFLIMVTTCGDLFNSLRLKQLSLNFPAMSFTPIALINDSFLTFLKSQEPTLQKLFLSRVRWDGSVRSFLSNFSKDFQDKVVEVGVFMVDVDTPAQKLLKSVTKIEFHAVGSRVFDLAAVQARQSRCRKSNALRWKKQSVVSLRFQNSPVNPTLEVVSLKDILHNFKTIQDLELLDLSNTDPTAATRSFSSIHLNCIFTKLEDLKNLKISNLELLTDSGLTHLDKWTLDKMRESGVFWPIPNLETIPILKAKKLKFLEMRDLSANVSDIFVYVALQFLPSLEKVGLFGNHKITEWGKAVLVRKFKKNPRFELFIGQERTRDGLSYLTDFP